MKTSPSFRLNAAAVAVALCFVSPVVWSNPTGGVVVSGSATMVNNGNTLTVTNTPGTVLNWQQFNIGQGQTTQFIQQSAQSTVLNRVVSNNPSQILGTLRSNGQVFLINPFGIMFGVGSVVDVNGLIASTLNISNADFLLGRLSFAGSNGTSVVNQGSITTPLGGRVYLIGNNVTNQGVITSPQGKVLLAAGNQVSLVDSTTPHISVTLSAPAGGQAVNLGTISAQGGSIDVYAPLIQQQGVLRADSAAIDPQGNIVLFATQNASLAQGSVTSANGAQGGNITVQSAGATTLAGQVSAQGNAGVGGTVNVLGNQVDLTRSAQIDASGTAGGGVVLVGGDFQGKNAAVQNAFNTTVAQGAIINVSALGKGNGGKSVVWANDTTTFNGNIFARGGAQGGNGGNVEVSGKRVLAFNGSVNTLAPLGSAGSLLLDPYSMCVLSTASPSCTGSTMTAAALAANVLTNGTYTLTTSGGDLAVLEPIVIGTAGQGVGKSLILEASAGSVWTLPAATMPGGAITTNGASLTLRAVKSTAGTGGEVHVSNTVSTFGGGLTINAQGLAVIENGGVMTEGGAVNINASRFTLGNAVATATQINTTAPATIPVGGAVSIKTNGTNAADGVTMSAGSSISAGNGLIDLAGMSYSNLNIANRATANYSIKSTGQGIFSFNNIANNFVDASVNAILIRTYTPPNSTTPYNVLFGTVGPCANALCFSPNTTDHISTVLGGVVAASGNITVTSNLQFNGGGQFALIAVGDIILNGSVSVLYPTGSAAPPTGSTSVSLIAGNNVINNVGAGALSVPAGYTWSLFAKDQTTSVLNGLSSNVINLGQGGVATNYTNAFVNGAIAKVSTGNFTFMQLIGNLLSAVGASTASGNQAIFWGPATSNDSLQFIANNNCVLNPQLCGATTRSNTQGTGDTTSALSTTANADLSYSPGLGVEDRTIWVSYEDVRRSRREARQAEDDLDHAERGANAHELDLKIAGLGVKRAEARVRETEMELRASEAELRAAKSPDDRVRAEIRHSVASFRRADADVQKAKADVRQAESEVKNAASPDAKTAAQQKQTDAQNRLARAEMRQAEADVEKAQLESKQADASSPNAAGKRTDVEVKQANLEVKRAAVELRGAKDPAARTAAEEKLTLVLAKQAEAEARKANTDAQHAEDEAKSSGSPLAQRLAVDKRLDAEVKQARADLRASEVAVKLAKDPEARASAAEKVLQAGLKQADSEGKQATQEAKQAREDIKTVRSEVSKAVLLKKAEADEARGTAKAIEVDTRKAELAVKKAEGAVKQAETAVQAAKSPEQRAAAEKQLAEKRGALEDKREQAERKHDALEKAQDAAEEKAHAYHTARSRRDERVIEAFGGVDLSAGGRKRSQELLEMRHDFMKEKFGSALKILAENPKAAEVRKCDGGSVAGCIPVEASRLNAAGDILPRIVLPLHTPTQAFLPAIQRKIAVVIGINAYQDPDIPALNGAVRDADAVAGMLKDKLGYDVRVVHNATRTDIVRTLNEVADETGSKDSVVVYYAGHGYQMEDTKEGYWIPSDASTSNPDNWISNSDINQLLTNIPAKQMLLVSDSCFSGALTSEQKVSSRVTSVETPAEILGKRSVVVMSSGGEEPVMDEGRDGHSIFAWHLMDKVQKLDSFEHGAEVFDSIRAGVAADGVPQLPEYGASVSAGHTKGGEYLFEVRQY